MSDALAPFPVSGLGLAAKMPAPCAMTGTLRCKSRPPSADPTGTNLPSILQHSFGSPVRLYRMPQGISNGTGQGYMWAAELGSSWPFDI